MPIKSSFNDYHLLINMIIFNASYLISSQGTFILHCDENFGVDLDGVAC